MHEPYEPRHPTFTDDASNLSTIAVSALAALVVTASLVALVRSAGPVHEVEVVPFVRVPAIAVVPLVPVVDVDAGADRLYGHVVTKEGDQLRGYLRWDGHEASWSDVLRATRPGGSALAGVRFGNVERLKPMGARNLELTLKTGQVVRLNAIAQQGRAALSPLTVETDGRVVEVPMHDLESVDFLPEPLDRAPSAERLHGTLITQSGLGFTGYIAWDLDELDDSGVLEGLRRQVPFAEIASIMRFGAEGVLVALADGSEIVLSGTPELSESNRGIVVSDPALGGVVVPWRQLQELRLHRSEAPATYEHFGGGEALTGTVVTTSGEELTGLVRWDMDEESTWELLDGQLDGIQFHVELSQVSTIEKWRYGAKVALLDGRNFYLAASNDVNWSNRGIEVRSDGRVSKVAWRDFEQFRRE